MRNEGDDSSGSGDAAREQFGAYLLFEQLGKGGMATVHRAKKRGIEGFEREVALKRILPHLSKDSEFVRWFVHEAKLASLLVHPNIAQIYDLGRVDDTYYIAMEHVSGFNLNRLLRYCYDQQVLPPISVVLSLMCELCEALEYAHTLPDDSGQPYGIIHRDVSPANLIVAHTGHLKVIDFGIAKALSLPDDDRIKGKLAYMAPEAIKGRPVGPASDVFSAGIVAHELLTAEPLFRAKSDQEMVQHVRQRAISPPSHKNDCVPASLDRVVMAALERDDQRRLRSAGAFRRALAAVAIEEGIRFSPSDVAEWWARNGALYEDNGPRESRPSSSRMLPQLVELSGSNHQELSSGASLEHLRRDSLAGSGAQGFGSVDRLPEGRPAAVSAPKLASAPEQLRSRTRAGIVLAGLCTVVVGLAAYQFIIRPTPAVTPALPTTSAERARPALVKFVVQPPDAAVQIGGKEVSRQSPFVLELEPGVYSVTVSRSGYERWRTQLTLQDHESQTISVALEPAAATVTSSSEPAALIAKRDGKALNDVAPEEVAVSPGSHRLPAGKRASGTATTGGARTVSPPPERSPPRASSGSTARSLAARELGMQLEDRSVEPVPAPAAVKPPEPPPKPAAQPAVAAVQLPSAAPPPRVSSAAPPLVPSSRITKLSGEIPPIQRGRGPASVLCKVCIGADGHVTSARVVRASPGIAADIERSLLGWRYKPYVDDSRQPSPACFAVSLRLVFERADGR